MGSLANLQHLEDVDIKNNPASVRDAALRAIVGAGSSAITSINMGGCSHVTDASMLPFAMVLGCQLRKLVMGRCRKITDISINALAASCTSLTHLDASMMMSGCC